MMRLAAGVAAAKAVGTLARTAGRGGGTSLPGKVLTRVEPHAIGRLARRLDRGSVVISATNGKTTTAAMVASILERTGARLVHNRAGANMAGGIASALADASRRGGRALTGDFGLFEVDEFWLGPVVEELEPRAMLLGNLFRDQLDRYGELETIADRWAAVVAARAAGRRSCSTPTTRWWPTWAACTSRRPRRAAARGEGAAAWPEAEIAPGVVYFGVDDDSLALPQLQHASDSKHCRRCGHAYTYSAVYLAHLGHYTLPELRPAAAAAGRRRHRRRAARHPLRRLHAARPPRRAPPPRASTTSTTRSGPPRSRSASASSSTTWSKGCRPSRPPSAAPRRSTSAAARRACCWSRTRPAPTRCCGRSRSRAASWTCSACSTTAPPTAATSAGSGTPTGSCWSAACAASRPRARAPPSSRCG